MASMDDALPLLLEIVRKEFRGCDVELLATAPDQTVTAVVRCKQKRPPTEQRLKYQWNSAVPSWKRIA